jgi:Fe-S cluster assembly protein SufD
MISEPAKAESSYQAAFRSLQAGGLSKAPPWLVRLRERAMDHFAAIGFPGVNEEEWRYTNIAPIARTDFLPAIADTGTPLALNAEVFSAHSYPEADQCRLVFVNGLLSLPHSSLPDVTAGAVVMGLDEALTSERFGDVVREYFGRVVEHQENGFTALNTAFAGSGAFVFIPQGVAVESPIQLLFLSQAGGPGVPGNTASLPRVLVVAEENSSASLIESYAGLDDVVRLTNAVVEVVLKEGARLVHYRVQNENPRAFHVTTTGAQLGRHSSFDTTSITLGAKLSRHNLSVILNHEGAECWVDGLYLVGDEQHTDTHSVIDHQQPHCTSHQLYKGILDGKSRAVFNGKVFVRHGALGTDANQTNKNLLLSNEAHVDTKPQLEILTDDVKCAHGAAIGQLAEDELFYLASRGIHEDLARNLLTYGFAEEVIDKIKIESIKARLDEAVLRRIRARLEA